MLVLRTDVRIEVWIVFESILSVTARLMCVPPVSYYSLYSILLKQVSYPCAVVPRIQSHVPGQFA